jgi:hypothetical protein
VNASVRPRAQRLRSEIAPAPCARAQIGRGDSPGGRGGHQRPTGQRPARFRADLVEPYGRQDGRTAAASITPHRSQSEVGDGARHQLEIDRPARAAAAEIGGHRRGQTLFERCARLHRAPLEDVGGLSLLERRQRRGRPTADLRAKRRAERLEMSEGRLVDRQHEPQLRTAFIDHLRGQRRHVGDLGRVHLRARRQRLFEMIEDEAEAALRFACNAAQIVGRVLSGDRGRDAEAAGRAHQLALEIPIAADRHHRHAAPGERGGETRAQERGLADTRHSGEGDDVRLTSEELIEQRDLVVASEERFCAPLVERREAAEKTAGSTRVGHRCGSALSNVRFEHLGLFVIVGDDDLAIVGVRRGRREETFDQVGHLFVQRPAFDRRQRIDHVPVVDHRQKSDAPAVLDRPQVPGLTRLGAGDARGVEGTGLVPRDGRDFRIAGHFDLRRKTG